VTSAAPLRQAGVALVGPTVWAAHFLTVYASESLACRFGLPAVHDAIIVGVTILAMVALTLHTSRTGRCRRAMVNDDRFEHFLQRSAWALNALSLVGIGWAALAAMLLSACR
jgi:hypothetical protein